LLVQLSSNIHTKTFSSLSHILLCKSYANISCLMLKVHHHAHFWDWIYFFFHFFYILLFCRKMMTQGNQHCYLARKFLYRIWSAMARDWALFMIIYVLCKYFVVVFDFSLLLKGILCLYEDLHRTVWNKFANCIDNVCRVSQGYWNSFSPLKILWEFSNVFFEYSQFHSLTPFLLLLQIFRISTRNINKIYLNLIIRHKSLIFT